MRRRSVFDHAVIDNRLESWVLAKRVEHRIGAEPSRREVKRDLDQRLEEIERRLRLSRQKADADELESAGVL